MQRRAFRAMGTEIELFVALGLPCVLVTTDGRTTTAGGLQ